MRMSLGEVKFSEGKGNNKGGAHMENGKEIAANQIW